MLGYCLSECARTTLWHFKRGAGTCLSIVLVISATILAYFVLALIAHGVSVWIYGTIVFFDPSLFVTVLELSTLTLLGFILFLTTALLYDIVRGLYKVTKKAVNVALNHDEFECKWIVKCEKGDTQ